MEHDLDSLEAFATQFAGNWRSFLGYFWTRDDIADPENWGIVYTRHSRSTPIEKQTQQTEMQNQLALHH